MIEEILFVFFLLNSLYVFSLAIAGRFYKNRAIPKPSKFNRIALFVPAYKEDQVILETAKHLTNLDYPKSHVEIVIIGDQLQAKTVEALMNYPVTMLKVNFQNSMKCKSLDFACRSISNDFDIAVVIDADNILPKEYLQRVNAFFEAGYPIVQAQRVAKNNNSSMAILDGMSEGINNHLFRQAHDVLGLSSALIGSGMSFPYSLFKEEIAKINSPVEDKVLQIKLAELNHRIFYARSIIVYDEKVDNPEDYKNQRKRWIAGQYQVLYNNFFKGFKLLLTKGNFNFFNMAILHNIFPSRINSLILLFVFTPIISILFYPQWDILVRWWCITFLYVLGIGISIPKKFYSKELLHAILLLPKVIYNTIIAVIQSGTARKKFIHTPHGATAPKSDTK